MDLFNNADGDAGAVELINRFSVEDLVGAESGVCDEEMSAFGISGKGETIRDERLGSFARACDHYAIGLVWLGRRNEFGQLVKQVSIGGEPVFCFVAVDDGMWFTGEEIEGDILVRVHLNQLCGGGGNTDEEKD